MEYRERKIVKLIFVSYENAFSSSENLYKHYKTFTNHCPKEHLLEAAKEAADEFCTKASAPNTGKPDLESFSAEGSLRKSF